MRVTRRTPDRACAIIARVPLASGLLTGKFTSETTFTDKDHRTYNRDRAAFNVGETFAGLPFGKGVELADGLRPVFSSVDAMASCALRAALDTRSRRRLHGDPRRVEPESGAG